MNQHAEPILEGAVCGGGGGGGGCGDGGGWEEDEGLYLYSLGGVTVEGAVDKQQGILLLIWTCLYPPLTTCLY
jgi:hypothetical protein